MIRLQRALLLLAVFFALAGTACVGFFFLSRKPEENLLAMAIGAAIFGVLSLLIGIFGIDSMKRIRTSRRIIVPSPSGEFPDASLPEQLRQRWAVLGERLNIDEPHYCTLAKAPCTSWSFCGAAPQSQSAELLKDGARGSGYEYQSLPIVHRSGPRISCLALQHGNAAAGGKPSEKTAE